MDYQEKKEMNIPMYNAVDVKDFQSSDYFKFLTLNNDSIIVKDYEEEINENTLCIIHIMLEDVYVVIYKRLLKTAVEELLNENKYKNIN